MFYGHDWRRSPMTSISNNDPRLAEKMTVGPAQSSRLRNGWIAIVCSAFLSSTIFSQERIPLWESTPPGDESTQLPAEKDLSDETPTLVAGQRIIRLANVSKPDIAIYKPSKEIDTGAAVVICPGGGYHILAYDLEGTEVAQWLNTIGVTGIVLKYRVPARNQAVRWKDAVQDAQRAMRVVRSHAGAWGIDPNRIGILGFSAGGDCAVRTCLLQESQYSKVDKIDDVSSLPNFAIAIYPGYLYSEETQSLQADLKVDQSSPPMFIVHAQDDPVTALSSVELFRALKKNGVASELHIFDRGGHGYGLRKTDAPVTEWPAACGRWLQTAGWLKKDGP